MYVSKLVNDIEKDYGKLPENLRKILCGRLRECGYNNQRDCDIIQNEIWDHFTYTYGKSPDWPVIKDLIEKYNKAVENTPCSASYAIGYKPRIKKIEISDVKISELDRTAAITLLDICKKKLSEKARVKDNPGRQKQP